MKLSIFFPLSLTSENKNKKLKDIIAISKKITLSTHTLATVLEDSLVARECEYLLPYLPDNGNRKEL
jgi:hypothetical protein